MAPIRSDSMYVGGQTCGGQACVLAGCSVHGVVLTKALFPQALGGENAAPAQEDVMEKELNRSERKLWQKIVAADG
jgi:hypothetical protein